MFEHQVVLLTRVKHLALEIKALSQNILAYSVNFIDKFSRRYPSRFFK